jgi:cytochrome b
MASDSAPVRVRIWDLPTRLFHWSIVLLIPFQWWTAKNDRMDLHMLAGQVLVGLIMFRILWGLFGSRTARFAHFLKGPRTVAAYLGSRAARALGHNPLGGWSAAAMLLLLAVQVGLGLFALDEEAIHGGPLSDLVSYDSGVRIAENHETVFYVLLGFIALHLAAITWYVVVRRDNLVAPMVTGRGTAKAGDGGIERVPLWRFVACAIAAAAASRLIFSVG